MRDHMPTIEVLYFTSENCSVCHVLKPKVEDLLTSEFTEFPLRTIDINSDVAFAAQYSVFTLPVLLILVDGKEQFRFVRSFSVMEVQEKLQRLHELIRS